MQTSIHLIELSWLSLLLIIGIVCSIVSVKLKISDLLLLIIAGVLIGSTGWVQFNPSFLAAFAIFALIMILFESSSKFKPREISTLSPYALKLAFIFTAFCLIFLTIATHFLFIKGSLKFILISVLFAGLMSGTSPSSVLSLLKEQKKKVAEILEFESIINTPFTVLIPLIIIDIYRGIIQAGQILIRFSQNIMAGLGCGLVMGLIIFRFMRKFYLQTISPLLIIASALITYTIAENIGGSGILAVAMLGIVFGLTNVREKEELTKFNKIFTNFLRIVVFVLLGLMLKIPFTKNFILKSLFLFGIYLLIRHFSVFLTFKNSSLTSKEKLFMTFNISKGVAVAVVAFTLITMLTTTGLFNMEIMGNIKIIVNLTFVFILYSIILASVMGRFENYFLVTPALSTLKKQPEKNQEKNQKFQKSEKSKTLKT